MATQALHVPERKVSAGRVFERAVATIRQNPVVTLGLALLFGAIPGVLVSFAVAQVRDDIMTGETPNIMTGFYVLMALSTVVGLVITAIVQGVLTRATVAHSEGRRASFAECVTAALPVAIPLIVLSILLAVGVGIGFMFLLVPGIMLYVMWSVAAPALIEERSGIFGSFGRSRELTKGARWTVFGIILVLVVVYYLLSLAVALVATSALGLPDPTDPTAGLSPGYLITSLVLGLLVNVFWGTVQASLYVELRDWKDGPASANLEEILR